MLYSHVLIKLRWFMASNHPITQTEFMYILRLPGCLHSELTRYYMGLHMQTLVLSPKYHGASTF